MEHWRDTWDGAGHWREPAARDGAAGPGVSTSSSGAVVPAHLPAMQHVAAALVGPADAEDAAQGTVLRAWQSWDSLRDVTAARSWLLSITSNVCRDWHRGRFGTRRSLTQPLLDDESAPPVTLLGTDPGKSDHTDALDLRQAINGLDPVLRAVVVVRYYAELDATEIGGLLNLPPATSAPDCAVCSHHRSTADLHDNGKVHLRHHHFAGAPFSTTWRF